MIAQGTEVGGDASITFETKKMCLFAGTANLALQMQRVPGANVRSIGAYLPDVPTSSPYADECAPSPVMLVPLRGEKYPDKDHACFFSLCSIRRLDVTSAIKHRLSNFSNQETFRKTSTRQFQPVSTVYRSLAKSKRVENLPVRANLA